MGGSLRGAFGMNTAHWTDNVAVDNSVAYVAIASIYNINRAGKQGWL